MFVLLPDWLSQVLRNTTVAVDLGHIRGAVGWRRWLGRDGGTSLLPCQPPFARESMTVHHLGVASESVRQEAMTECSPQSHTEELWSYEAERVDLERRAWTVWAGDQDG
jgi:hypothetical protein